MDFLKASTAVTVKIGPFLDNEDGDTEKTGLTIAQSDVQLSKNGAAMAQKNNSTACTHDKLGYYNCPLSTTDTGTIGILKLAVHVSGALAVWHEFAVLHANVYDSLFGDKALAKTDTVMDANVTKIAGSNVSTTSAQLGVNVVNWKGSGAQNMTGDAYARLGAPKGVSHAADVAEVLSAVGDVQVQTDKLDNLADTDDVAAAVRDVNNTNPAPDSLGEAVNTAAAGGGGGGVADWTTSEKQQIRSALGVDGDKVAAVSGQLQSLSSTVTTNLDAKVSVVKAQTDKLVFDGSSNVKSTPQTNVTVGDYAVGKAPLTAQETEDAVDDALIDYTAAKTSDVPSAIDNADALLKRDWTSVTGEASRSVLNALRTFRNRMFISAGVMTVTKEDDSTTAWSADVESAEGADPIVEVKPK